MHVSIHFEKLNHPDFKSLAQTLFSSVMGGGNTPRKGKKTYVDLIGTFSTPLPHHDTYHPDTPLQWSRQTCRSKVVPHKVTPRLQFGSLPSFSLTAQRTESKRPRKPYCFVSTLTQEIMTSCASSTNQPVWNDDCTLYAPSPRFLPHALTKRQQGAG